MNVVKLTRNLHIQEKLAYYLKGCLDYIHQEEAPGWNIEADQAIFNWCGDYINHPEAIVWTGPTMTHPLLDCLESIHDLSCMDRERALNCIAEYTAANIAVQNFSHEPFLVVDQGGMLMFYSEKDWAQENQEYETAKMAQALAL